MKNSSGFESDFNYLIPLIFRNLRRGLFRAYIFIVFKVDVFSNRINDWTESKRFSWWKTGQFNYTNILIFASSRNWRIFLVTYFIYSISILIRDVTLNSLLWILFWLVSSYAKNNFLLVKSIIYIHHLKKIGVCSTCT